MKVGIFLFITLMMSVGCQKSKNKEAQPNNPAAQVNVMEYVDGQTYNNLSKDFEGQSDIEIVTDTLIFPDNFVGNLNGRNLKISAKKIISNGAQIETYSRSSTAERGRVGHSGGSVQIQVNVIEGHLNVVMRGQAGGRGIVFGKAAQLFGSPGEGIFWCFVGGANQTPRPMLEHPALGERGANGGSTGNLFFEGPLSNFSYSLEPGAAGERGESGTLGMGETYSQMVWDKEYNILGKSVRCPDPGLSNEPGIRGLSGEVIQPTLIDVKNR